MKFQSCDCRRVDPPAEYDDIYKLEVGDFYWHDGKCYVRLPADGRGYNRGLPVYRGGEPKPASVAWQWDGDPDRPTLTPSIRALDGDETVWHGYMTAGRLEACE